MQKAELKEYIIGRTGYRKKLKVANFTDGYNENFREIRYKSKIAEEDFFQYVDVADRQAETFTENSLSFLCAREKEKQKSRENFSRIVQSNRGRQKNEIVSERGITLLTLIITVVIMIILAAVTINVTLRDGGLVDQAKHAAEQTTNATKSEGEQLDDVASQINDIIAGIGSGGSGGDVTNSTGGEDTNQVGETNTVDTNSVETNSVDANSVEETNTVGTNTIEPEPEPLPDNTISIGEPDWQENGTANVTVSTTEDGVTIEYQIGGTEEGKWTAVEGGTIEGIENGETVYVRITDGEQASNPQEKKVEDTTAPENANIEINPASVLIGENLTATVTHVDSGIGVDVENSRWIMTQSADAIGTGDGELSKYMEKFTTNPETITLDSSSAGTYYLHVLTVDKAGNKTETVSSAITISSITGTIMQNGDVSWNAGKATLVLQSSETAGSQLKIVYKINGEGDWIDYNGTSITGLKHGDKVTACLTNNGETTFGPEGEFEIKDEEAPTVTVTAQGSPTTNSITVTAVASDNESGMKDSPTYTFQYKTSGAGSYATPDGAENISNATYTFTGLTQGTSYDIQVIVNGDNAGNTGTGTTQATTATVPGASEGLETGTITASPVTWSGGKASTTLSTNENFKIQYQVNGTSESGWSTAADSPVTVSNLNHNDTVYARLWDGNNGGNYAAINIIDGTDPTVSVTVGTITETSIAVSVSASDGQSGLAESGTYKYYLNNSLKQTTTEKSYTFTGLTGGTKYTIRVETVDKAGNIGSNTKQATTTVPSISETESQVANYADVDGNGTVDGVIYADLAIGGSGEWGTNIVVTYTIPKGSNFKKYRVTQENYSGSFGTGKVIAPINGSSGNERLYVMALSDVDSREHCWYHSARDMNDYETTTSTAFGRGEQNTINMIAKWNSSGYGSQNENGSFPDMWGLSAVNSRTWNGTDGWYVPSQEEWAAFAEQLGITSSYYRTYDLSSSYWSSSQYSNGADIVAFDEGYIHGYNTAITNYVRLGTTF